MSKIKADITDIFSSIQGEGIFLGAKQIFVRFRKCNLACSFCDEPRDGAAKEYTPDELLREVKFIELSNGPHHSISLTGGEPLLYAEFLKVFLKAARKEKVVSYLETNGTLPRELDKVIDLIDIVAMDIKVPSSTGERDFWKEHLEFLRIASWKKTFVKIVVTNDTKDGDILKAITMVKKIKGNIPIVIQPASPIRKGDAAITSDKLMEFMKIGLRHNAENIRVIPQMHKMMGIK